MVALWFSDVSLTERTRDGRLIWSTSGDLFQAFAAKCMQTRRKFGVPDDIGA